LEIEQKSAIIFELQEKLKDRKVPKTPKPQQYENVITALFYSFEKFISVRLALTKL
jgi:hypothetical protein